MKILLVSVGSRGDMEPFLAAAEILQKSGHEVVCLFPEQFRNLAEESGFRFASLGSEFLNMLYSKDGKNAMGGSGNQFQKLISILKLAKIQVTNNRLMTERQFKVVQEESPDRIIHHAKAMYPVIWEIDNPGKTTLLSPVPYLHYAKGHTHLAFNSNWGETLNKLTFKLADWGLTKTIMTSVKWLKLPYSKSEVKKALTSHKVVYALSPQLFTRPANWPKSLQVLGYHERNKAIAWTPDNQLLDFLRHHKKPMLVTFGSMTNPKPEEKTNIILKILEKNNIPAIINVSNGGIVKPTQYSKELFHFVESIPYEWVFPKVYAVMHHGGSGTTHMALKYGCASMIIPHIIDQFLWNKLCVEKGVGPLGIKVGKITVKNLEHKVIDLYTNPSYKAKAKEISVLMQQENFKDDLVKALTE